MGKSHQFPFYSSNFVATSPLELIYSDVWGPAIVSAGGYKYYVSFIDSYSRFTWLFLLKRKSDVTQAFLQFQAKVERQLQRKIINFQSDWGGEYQGLNSYLRTCGIHHRVSCPHTHQQNGAAERKHRHIVDMGLTLLAHSSLPLKLWDEAFSTSCHLINRLPSPTIDNTTPLERLFHTKPDYDFLRIFGCACWPNLRPFNDRKLAFRSLRCVFVGYSTMHRGYKCMDPNTGRVYLSRDVTFDESCFPFAESSPQNSSPEVTESSLCPLSVQPVPVPAPLPPVLHASPPHDSQVAPSMPSSASSDHPVEKNHW
jgi:histone deacetylase 1/2